MTDHDNNAPWNPSEPTRAGWTQERTYPDGSKRKVWFMPSLPPARPRNLARKLDAACNGDRKAARLKARTSRMIAADLDAERLENQQATEQKENK